MKLFIFRKKALFVRAGGALIALTLVLGQVFSGPSTVLAASILSDSFGTGSTANDVLGWKESEHPNDNATDVVAKQSSTTSTSSDYQSPDGGRFVKIAGDNDEWFCRQVNTAGYESLSLKYYWRGEASAEADDFGVVELRANGTSDSSCSSNDNGGWSTLASHPLDNASGDNNQTQEAWALNTVNLPTDSDGLFLVRFRNHSSADAEYFRVDGVSVDGTLIPTDVCENIDGMQSEAPKGYSIKYQQDQSQCIPDTVNVTVCKKDDEGNLLPGWMINLDWNSENNNHWDALTGQDGCAYFNGIHAHDYVVSEINKPNWSLVSLPNETGHIQAFSEQNGPYYIVNRYTPPNPTTATVIATKVVCDAEQYLPNWGKNEIDRSISATTASDFVAASNGKCHFQPGWQFEWSPVFVDETMDNAHDGGSKWTDFSLTNASGVATAAVSTESGVVWVREEMKDGYLPFSGDHDGTDGWDEVSAEMYCDADVINYDNIDYISEPKADSTYHCVAFNVATEQPLACNPEENLIKNGGFETPDVSTGGYGIFPEGTTGLEWLVDWVAEQTSGIKGLEIQDHAAGDPAEGSGEQFAELDGDHPVKIWQDIQTIPGKEYKLTFKYSPRPNQESGTNMLEAWANGTKLGATLSGTPGSITNWITETRTFIADSTATKIKFIDTDADNSYGGYLDDVNLSCVGDPTPQCEEENETITDTFMFDCNLADAGQTCAINHEKQVTLSKQGTINASYTINPNHCSAIKIETYVDGVLKGATDFIGWNGDPLARSTSAALLNNLSVGAGTHTIALKAIGEVGGCNQGNLVSWGGTMTVETQTMCTDLPPVEEDTTSDVTMCKIDADGNKLSGWTLMLKKGAKLDTLSIPANDADGVETNVSLDGGAPYVAVANGTWLNNRGEQNLVDAEYSTVNSWTTHMDGYDGYGQDILELKINNVLGAWGAYNALHTYAQGFTQAVAGKAVFGIADSFYGDNQGELAVDIYEGYVGVTGENGCVTFTDVPFGDYSVGEVNQSGWYPVNENATRAVNQPTQTITVENHYDFCPDKEGVQASTEECGGGSEEPVVSACSDDKDNGDEEDTLSDEQDPGCHTDGDVHNADSYDPKDNDESNEATQCSDGVENDSDNLIDSLDPGCHSDGNATDGDDTYNASDDEESNGSSRSGSIPNGGGAVLGAFIGPAVLGDNMCGEYITEYIKFGAKNDSANVSRLQTFLNEYLGLSLTVDGQYNQATFDAVKQFQLKEAGEVLSPWIGVTLKDKVATGWVYKTTRRWINMIKCPELNIPKFEKGELTVY